MDITDKNSEAFIQYDDPSYIEKLQHIDTSLNKIINEFLLSQYNETGSSDNITDGVDSLITNAISGDGSGGYGIPNAGVVWGDGLGFNEDTGVISIDDGTGIATTHIITLGTASSAYGYNLNITDVIWSSPFGSSSPATVPSGTENEFGLMAFATDEAQDYFHIAISGVQTKDFFSEAKAIGLFGLSIDSFDSTYSIVNVDGDWTTFWRWPISDVGNWSTLGNRNAGFVYNSIYQTNATTESFYFEPNSLYAWNSWPDPDPEDIDTYVIRFAQGGKLDVYAGFASVLYPSSGDLGDPAIFGKHNGIGIGLVANSGDVDEWIILYLQNSDGTENYRLSGSMFSSPLDTVDAIYHDTPDDANWGTKAFGWNVGVLGWGGVGFDEFTLTNLD